MKSTKSRLMASLLVMILCVTAFFGSTYAWFTDEATSAGNKIEAGNLEIDLLLKNDQGQFVSIKENQDPIFTDEIKWEPGYTVLRFLKIQNEGNLAIKWHAKLYAQNLGTLADVIDVYVAPGLKGYNTANGRDFTVGTNFHRVGTLREFVNEIEGEISDSLEPKGAYDEEDEDFFGIALKMQESAGNEYKGAVLGDFDIRIEATQMAFEEDSFDDKYDEDAEY